MEMQQHYDKTRKPAAESSEQDSENSIDEHVAEHGPGVVAFGARELM